MIYRRGFHSVCNADEVQEEKLSNVHDIYIYIYNFLQPYMWIVKYSRIKHVISYLVSVFLTKPSQHYDDTKFYTFHF